MGRVSRLVRWGSAVVFCLLAAGCLPLSETEDLEATPTWTPNATLVEISAMLTETRAAPTITPTQHITITPTRTITPTVPVVGRAGEIIQAEGMQLILLAQQTETAIDRSKAATGLVYLNMEVVLANASEQPQEYYSMFFRLVGPGGVEYEPSNVAIWPLLQGGTLQPGDFTRGNIAFLIPEDAASLRLRYRNSSDPEAFPPLWVDLSRPPAANTPVAPAASRQPRLPGSGQRIEAAGVAVTIDQTTAEIRMARTRATQGRIFVDLLVTIQNLSRPDTPYNPFYFKAKDAQGYEYPPVVIALDSLLHPGSLGPGQKVSGHVVFEVPEGTQWLVISYLPQVLVEDYDEILLGIAVPEPK